MRAIFSKPIAVLAGLISKGTGKMTDILTTVETGAGNALAEGLTVEHAVVGEVESLVGIGSAATDAAASSASATAAPAVAPIDALLSTVKSLIAVDGTEPKAWDALVTLAKAKAGSVDADAILAKLKLVLPLSGAVLVAWDETVAAAKALIEA